MIWHLGGRQPVARVHVGSVIFVTQDANFLKPFDGCGPYPAGDERSGWKTVRQGQSCTVHRSSNQRILVHGFFKGNPSYKSFRALRSAVGATESHVPSRRRETG